MKNSWIYGILSVAFLVYMCGGDDSSDIKYEQLRQCVFGFVDARIYDVEVGSVNKTGSNPPTYEFQYSYMYNGKQVNGTGHCILDANGNIKEAWDYHKRIEFNYQP